MRTSIYGYSRAALAALAVIAAVTVAGAGAAEDDCQPSGEYRYVCGPQAAEDLVTVPATRFIIASAYAPGSPFYLIDSANKTWSALNPAAVSEPRPIPDPFAACPGAPDITNLVTHGLNIRPGKGGHSTLYVVGHGGREAIEVFDVDANGDSPVLTWQGCVMLPEGMAANSVASFTDGSLVVTVPLHPGKTLGDALKQQLTGAVYRWSPGDKGFTIIEGTELPYANGIEVSADGREFYVASTGLFTVTAYSNSNPARILRKTEPMAFVPDNLHMGNDGELITAGLVVEHAECGTVGGPVEFSLEEFASCPRPFIVKAVDPLTMKTRDVARGPANANFSNVTMALQVGQELWIGTFFGDRVAYRSLP